MIVRYTGLAPVAGATITVVDHGTADLVDLFEDLDGATPLGNPLTADARTGIYAFCAEQGDYDVQIQTGNALPSARTPDANVYAVAAGTSPNRTVSLVADDEGNQIVLSQVTY